MPFWQKDDLSQIIRWATQTPSARVIIFPVCYTTCPAHLTTATRKILLSAISWQKQLPRARIVVGNYDILTDTEQRLKEELFREYGVDPSQVIWIPDSIGNSADEARKAAQAVAARKLSPTVILAITGPMHSRTARKVSKHEFRKSDVLVDCIEDWRDETQPDHIVKVQQSQWKWFLTNVLRQFILFWPYGFEFIARRHHKITRNITTTA